MERGAEVKAHPKRLKKGRCTPSQHHSQASNAPLVGISEGRYGPSRMHYASAPMPFSPYNTYVAVCNPLLGLHQVQEAPRGAFRMDGAAVCSTCFRVSAAVTPLRHSDQ